MFENTFNFRRPFSLSPNPLEDEFQKPRINPFEVDPNELPQTAKTSSFLDEYTKAMSERPERDALKALINNAPTREQFQPNKMTRLGAVLAGVSTGFRNPAAGVETAQHIIDRPFNEAQQTYNDKLRNVGALAGMEGEDVRTKIEGLKTSHDFETNERDFQANQKYRSDSLKAQGWHVYTDDKTGRLMAAHPNGELKDLGPSGQSAAEKAAQKKIEDDREQAGKIAAIRETGSQQIAVANARGEKAIQLQDRKNQQTLTHVIDKINASPDERMKAAWSRVYQLISEGVQVNDYLNLKGDVPVVEYQGYGAPDAADVAAMDRIKKAFATETTPVVPAALGGANAPTASHGTTVAPAPLPTGWSKTVKKQ